jgi:hypothetical protein
MDVTDKLMRIARDEGYPDVIDFLEDQAFDSVCMGICTNPGCDYTSHVEPDQAHGYCEMCDTRTVASALIVAGIF